MAVQVAALAVVAHDAVGHPAVNAIEYFLDESESALERLADEYLCDRLSYSSVIVLKYLEQASCDAAALRPALRITGSARQESLAGYATD